MDRDTRNLLERTTQQARRLLELEYKRQLEGTFDILPDGTIHPDAGRHLSDEECFLRGRLVTAIEHRRAQGESPADSVDNFIRECAFTFLNRIVALRMIEARGLIKPSISKGEESSGFTNEFLLLAPGLKSLPDKGYRLYLESLFDEIGREVGVLFDRGDLAGQLWPDRPRLLELLDLLNDPGLDEAWGADETMGWVYQYFNTDEERRQMRADSAAPRNRREMAVRNQFFTPRYVVEFLTDNTLARTWYEMLRGQTLLKERCALMVWSPREHFLQPGERPDRTEAAGDGNPKELFRRTVVPHCPPKDPREIRVLDPACGSGHFLLYCFDLLEVIYQEAWEYDIGAIRKDYPSKAELDRAVPELILRHNLHGIDIDPRAAQIGSLALWMRAQRSWHTIPRAQRAPIRKTNIVIAEPMPGETDLLDEFCDTLSPTLLGQLVKGVFQSMHIVGDAGSLLRIEAEIAKMIADARQQWLEEETPTDRTGHPLLFATSNQRTLFETGLLPTDFWDFAEERLLEALHRFACIAGNGDGFRRRLFAEDAEHGFAFIDVCRQRYDVILMNPPFGEASLGSREYLYDSLPEAARDLFAGFVSRFNDLLVENGRLGVLSNRTAFFSDYLSSWRISNFLGEKTSLAVVADLGYGVLDALVEAAAYVCHNGRDQDCLFINALSTVEKAEAISRQIKAVQLGGIGRGSVFRNLRIFERLPDHRLLYQLHAFWIDKLNLSGDHPLYRSKAGLTSGDDARNLRLFWEVDPAVIGTRWRWLAKGGGFSRYLSDLHLLIDWQNAAFLHRVRNSELYGQRGVTYTERTTSNLSARVLNEGSCFSGPGPGIIPLQAKHLQFLLAYMNSFVACYCLESIIGGGDWSIKGTAARHLEPGYVKYLPVVEIDDDTADWFRVQVNELIGILEDLNEDETSALFTYVRCNRTNTIQESLTGETRYRFGRLSVAYNIVESLEKRMTLLLDLPESRIRDAYSDTGWPWPDVDCRAEQVPPTVLELDPLEPCAAPEQGNATGPRHRFETKLSHYLHSGVERQARVLGIRPAALCRLLAEKARPEEAALLRYVTCMVSYLVGCAFGRWDIRLAIRKSSVAAAVADPFGELPVCSFGVLKGAEGLPLAEGEYERLRAAGLWDYPIDLPWDGILVDDPSESRDIENSVRRVLDVIWCEGMRAIEGEVCGVLGTQSLREYFRKPGGFFADHLKRYCKSRRHAPIYWRLSSSSGGYSIWLYYHRLGRDTLWRVLNDFVKPRLAREVRRLSGLRDGPGEAPSPSQRRAMQEQEAFVAELLAFRDEIERIAPVWDPNLNDGVLLNFAPLWKLVPQLPAWQRELRDCWQRLCEGEYEWAHLAMHLWPERVVPKCASDRSMAIAHGLGEQFWEEQADGQWRPKKRTASEIAELVQERSSNVVKASLEKLMAQTSGLPTGRRGKGSTRRNA